MMLCYGQALLAPLRSGLQLSNFLGSHTCLTMPGLFGGRGLLSTMWINALSIISRFRSVWNKEMETFFMKGVIHLLMVQWDLGNVCSLTLLSWWKVKKMHVGRLQSELILWLISAPCPQTHCFFSEVALLAHLWRLRSSRWWFLTHFSAFGRSRLSALGAQSFQMPPTPHPQTLRFEGNTTEPRAGCQCWAGEAGVEVENCGQEEIRANSSKTIWQEMTEQRPHTAPLGLGSERERAARGRSPPIAEPCQSAVGEDDEIIKHFPCVFFIRPVLFFFQVLGKQNRSPASGSTAAGRLPWEPQLRK